MYIFRVYEQGEVQPNYNVADLRGNTLPCSVSLLNIRMLLKARICADLNKNDNLVWQFPCFLADDNLKVTIHSFKCQGTDSTVLKKMLPIKEDSCSYLVNYTLPPK